MTKEKTFGIFGKYFILDQLARGGMAEIDLARPASSVGNGRILVLKRILPQAFLDPEYISMFQSETQVSMGFHHPNLVQIYDFGKVEDEHYIAMEYIEGKNLREISSKFLSGEKTIPIHLTVNLIAQTAGGLHYAHHFRNHVTGEVLHVIHRDISPQNILVSYEGNVKIIDFGVAKSESVHADKTRTGCIKGKLNYLSPEQLFQKDLDGRSDLFSLGVVMWELLTGHKLFYQQGQNDMEVMQSIAHCETFILPPSNFNSEVSPALDAIVMKALAKERDDRYSNAEEFQRVLNDFLRLEYPNSNAKSVGDALKLIFSAELEEERLHIKMINQSAQKQLQGEESSSFTPKPRSLAPRLEMYHDGQPVTSALNSPAQASEFILSKNVREQFYIKLTFGRALGLLMYAATLLVLRLDQDQIVLNAIFGERQSPIAQARPVSPKEGATPVLEKPPVLQSLPVAQVSQDPIEKGNQPTVSPRKISVHINLVRKSGPAVTAVLVNQRPLNLRKPYVQVANDQKFFVEVFRKGSKSLSKAYQLKSKSLRSPASYDLKLVLY